MKLQDRYRELLRGSFTEDRPLRSLAADIGRLQYLRNTILAHSVELRADTAHQLTDDFQRERSVLSEVLSKFKSKYGELEHLDGTEPLRQFLGGDLGQYHRPQAVHHLTPPRLHASSGSVLHGNSAIVNGYDGLVPTDEGRSHEERVPFRPSLSLTRANPLAHETAFDEDIFVDDDDELFPAANDFVVQHDILGESSEDDNPKTTFSSKPSRLADGDSDTGFEEAPLLNDDDHLQAAYDRTMAALRLKDHREHLGKYGTTITDQSSNSPSIGRAPRPPSRQRPPPEALDLDHHAKTTVSPSKIVKRKTADSTLEPDAHPRSVDKRKRTHAEVEKKQKKKSKGKSKMKSKREVDSAVRSSSSQSKKPTHDRLRVKSKNGDPSILAGVRSKSSSLETPGEKVRAVVNAYQRYRVLTAGVKSPSSLHPAVPGRVQLHAMPRMSLDLQGKTKNVVRPKSASVRSGKDSDGTRQRVRPHSANKSSKSVAQLEQPLSAWQPETLSMSPAHGNRTKRIAATRAANADVDMDVLHDAVRIGELREQAERDRRELEYLSILEDLDMQGETAAVRDYLSVRAESLAQGVRSSVRPDSRLGFRSLNAERAVPGGSDVSGDEELDDSYMDETYSDEDEDEYSYDAAELAAECAALEDTEEQTASHSRRIRSSTDDDDFSSLSGSDVNHHTIVQGGHRQPAIVDSKYQVASALETLAASHLAVQSSSRVSSSVHSRADYPQPASVMSELEGGDLSALDRMSLSTDDQQWKEQRKVLHKIRDRADDIVFRIASLSQAHEGNR